MSSMPSILTGRRLVVVDDEPAITYMLQLKFRTSGAQVHTCNNGAAALKLINELKPDLLVSDYQMPVMDGFTLAKQLTDSPATQYLPIIMLTARGHKLSPSDLLKTNIREVVSKPFSGRGLVATAEEVLQESASLRVAG
jgi:CheY-like chemotaxis protein